MKVLLLLLLCLSCGCSSLSMSFTYGRERAHNYLDDYDDALECNKVMVLQESLNVLNVYLYNFDRMRSVGYENMIPRISEKISSNFYRPLVDDFLLKEHANLLTVYNLKPYGEDYFFHLSSLRDGLLVVVLEKSHRLLHEIPKQIEEINNSR